MITVTKKQIKELDERLLQSYIQNQLLQYSSQFKTEIINRDNLNKWINEGSKFGIIYTNDLDKFIHLHLISEKMRIRPFDKGIIYYLTHSSMEPEEKLNIIEQNILKL